MNIDISKAHPLRGEVTVPGDKSISHRAVMIGGLSSGTTRIHGFLKAADPLSTIACYRAMGIAIDVAESGINVHGKGKRGLNTSVKPLDAGNSGTTMRLLSGILCGQKFSSVITGDRFLLKRPMNRIIDPLKKMGADISATDNGTAPLSIRPSTNLHSIDYELPIASAQVKSAVLFAGLYAQGITRVIEFSPSRDHTERMLGLTVVMEGTKKIVSINGEMDLSAQEFSVPGDPSSAAYFIVAAVLVPGSELLIKNVGLNPTRTGYLDVLRHMGANITLLNQKTIGGEPIGDILVKHSLLKSDVTLEGNIIPNIIDEIPILAVAGAHSIGRFEVKDAKDLRTKETDRISALCSNLKKMGIWIDEFEDGFAFESKNELLPNEFESFHDHRIAMAFGIAALATDGTCAIHDAECVDISYPRFWETVQSLQQ